MPARVDDLRVRQDQMDERYEHPVVRQLVDEDWPSGAPLDGRATKIFLASLSALVDAQLRSGRRIVTTLPSDRRHVGKLRSPLDLTVRRQDLLDERRTGARHPHD